MFISSNIYYLGLFPLMYLFCNLVTAQNTQIVQEARAAACKLASL